MNFFKQFARHRFYFILRLARDGIKKQQGIGFLEMIVALGVIVTGVIGGLTLTTFNLASSTSSEGKLLAANLAREAIEVVRNKRDSNWLAEAGWSAGVLTGNNYRLVTDFDPEQNSWQFTNQAVGIADCDSCRLYYHPESGVFNHTAGETGQLTSYKRLATLRQICWIDVIDEEAVLGNGEKCSDSSLEWVGWEAEAEVVWTDSTGQHQTSVIDRLYDWK